MPIIGKIYYPFICFKGEKYAILLHGFEEKDNKKQSKYSYDKAITVAQKRFEEVVKDD
ncbi:MAG: hypothetical protein Q7J85_03580 [Bacillota bacterium]|nr:hypothetical protein [Bacillota bacterium]